ncbi:hypothetical protein [Methylomonas sp. MK1]|uniref:hypothetical protein n=1 Tax=Methylomonas sp. MK1 TaxID=1131552 RepID=UPI00035D024E|nr:hypothetical protein [Methylomonas sp. MK1]
MNGPKLTVCLYVADSCGATNRTKPAKLTTGLEVQVPEYIESGEMEKINTETGKYSSRA